MGADGAAELKMLQDAGAVTFAQSKESSVVHGMPGTAISLGAADHVLAPDEIGARLAELVRGNQVRD
jgi:two-component system chemotaxis response regulator CheB